MLNNFKYLGKTPDGGNIYVKPYDESEDKSKEKKPIIIPKMDTRVDEAYANSEESEDK